MLLSARVGGRRRRADDGSGLMALASSPEGRLSRGAAETDRGNCRRLQEAPARRRRARRAGRSLIAADLGTEVARRVIDNSVARASARRSPIEEIKQTLAEEISAILLPVAQPLRLDAAKKPHVVLVVGVNGTGKTTTIGKLAQLPPAGTASRFWWLATRSAPQRWSSCRSGRARRCSRDRQWCERRFRRGCRSMR